MSRPHFYSLIGQTAVPARVEQETPGTPEHTAALIEWARDFDIPEYRRVMYNVIGPSYKVSTLFLGCDHNHSAFVRRLSVDEALPLLFETVIYANGTLAVVERWATWDRAEQGHKELSTLCSEAHAQAMKS